MSTEDTRWWREANAADARDGGRVIHQFLEAPRPDDSAEFSRALAVFILLGGSDISIREKIDKIDGYPHAGLTRDALIACQTKLAQFPDATPDWLEKSIQEIGRRADKAFADWIRTSRPIILKPKD